MTAQHKPGETIEVKPGAPAPVFMPPPLLTQLAAEFTGKDVKTRKSFGGPELTYIGIDATIRRLNEVLGAAWSFDLDNVSVTESGQITTKSGKTSPAFLAVVSGHITALDKRAGGVGADRDTDPDKAVKTALAEALKKAGHQFGIALYLWTEGGRKSAQRKMALAGGSQAAMKQEVFSLAKERLDNPKPTAAQVAKAFGVKAGDLSDEATLIKILEDEGLL
jgi:hypothetical protein